MTPTLTTRFAPSPTGFLHVGGARTALYNYIHAKQNNGVFRLRIEDTDQKRSSPEMIQAIFNGLRWLGLEWGDEVVYQGANAFRHRQMAELLWQNGWAYPCFCSREEMEIHRQNFQYDGHCRKLAPVVIEHKLQVGTPYSLRFKVPEGVTSWNDIIHGNIQVHNQEIEDFVILRSDGSPIYQLAVVIDDHDMGITDIIRGDDHISNTPKQLLLYRAFSWEIPRFAHIPLILGMDKKRLSKRHGATSVEEYQQNGILSDALYNYLAILGWLPENDQEILTREEIYQNFSLTHISKKSAVFDEKKLAWINQQHILRASPQQVIEQILPLWENAGFIRQNNLNYNPEKKLKIIALLQPRATYLTDFVELASYFFIDPKSYDPDGLRKHLNDEQIWHSLSLLLPHLESLKKFHAQNIESDLRKFAEEQKISASKLIHPLRLALTGRTASPGLFEVMELLGREVVLNRFRLFLNQRATFKNPLSDLKE